MKSMVCQSNQNGFNHIPIHNEKYVFDEFRRENYPYCLNYPLIKVEDNEWKKFESNPFASYFTQEVSKYAENCNNNHTIFDEYFAIDAINEKVGLTNEIKPYSMLIDVFKEMTNHLQCHCTVDDINEIR